MENMKKRTGEARFKRRATAARSTIDRIKVAQRLKQYIREMTIFGKHAKMIRDVPGENGFKNTQFCKVPKLPILPKLSCKR